MGYLYAKSPCRDLDERGCNVIFKEPDYTVQGMSVLPCKCRVHNTYFWLIEHKTSGGKYILYKNNYEKQNEQK